MYIFIYGYAFRRASRYRAETLHGGRGRAPRFVDIFSRRPKDKDHPELKLL